jgi:hypothetical protein
VCTKTRQQQSTEKYRNYSMKINTCLLMSTALLATAVTSLGQPIITEQPSDHAVYVGESVTFATTYTANGPLFQWRFNGSDLPNQRSETLELSDVQFANAGDYSVVIKDPGGSVASQVARLDVLPDDVVRIGGQELRFGQPSAPIWEAPGIDDEAQSVTGDGLTIFYGSKAPGGSGDLDIWMATRPTRSSPWSAPVNLGPTVNSPDIDTSPRLSPDGLSLYFSSTRPGGYGRYDLWVTSRSSLSAPFGTPVNLGPDVNSSKDDGIPDISADNRTLVFASAYRSGGLGSYDVWMTTRTDSQAPWEPAVSLDQPVNSDMWEIPVALSRDGLTLYFKSDRTDQVGALFVSQRASREAPFGPATLIRPILNIGTGGADFSSLSDDATTLYVGTYRPHDPQGGEWPQVVEIGITPLGKLTVPGRNALGKFQFELLGRKGATYEIQTSTNLSSWTPWLTTNTTDRVLLVDPASDGGSHRFYRAVSR